MLLRYLYWSFTHIMEYPNSVSKRPNLMDLIKKTKALISGWHCPICCLGKQASSLPVNWHNVRESQGCFFSGNDRGKKAKMFFRKLIDMILTWSISCGFSCVHISADSRLSRVGELTASPTAALTAKLGEVCIQFRWVSPFLLGISWLP